MMARAGGLLIGLTALFAVLLGLGCPAAAHAVPSLPTTINYSYDGHDGSSVMPDPAVERGPLAQLHRATTYDTAGFQSGGESVRPNAPVSPETYDYDDLIGFVPTASGSPGAEQQFGSTASGSVVVRRSSR